MSDGITASRAEVMETVYELSRLLNTGLDRDTLAILMALIQKGVNPEALAAVVKDLRKDAAEQQQQQTEAPRERTFTGGKQPLSTQELQVSQVCRKKQKRVPDA
ncbi:Mitotic-spindle organizing protein 1 [Phytophthora pseudosyringae]|uniref:Mitotic-spindle organizing protein 1 n=1 Tax=Phytophthora pseudosyringae TaxID=221518 RepID=A0A8T1WIT9_9STRA|nr:Mitotic-spindle organizing protein 1 [Phytophthora pseudosyringae]